MTSKDEPLKVMDLETLDETTPLPPPPSSSSKDAKSRGVFDRLTYGGPARGPRKTSDDQTGGAESGAGGKGVGSGRATKGRAAASKTKGKPSSSSATRAATSAANSGAATSGAAPAANPADGVTTPSSGSGSVFDRLTSGEKLYRNSSQTKKGNAAAATKRPDAEPASSNVKPSASAAALESAQSIDSPTVLPPSTTNELANGALVSPDREELVIDDDDNDDEPVINVSLIQPPTKLGSATKKSKSADPPVKRRQSWKIVRIPLSLVERTSLARGALPVLPRPMAWLCLLLNGVLPGSGTMLSGVLAMCFGAPRFSVRVTAEHRLLALVINLLVGICQTVSVLFCLVGWCWALGWGILLVKVAGYYVTWKKSNDNNPDEDRRMMMNVPISITADEERY